MTTLQIASVFIALIAFFYFLGNHEEPSAHFLVKVGAGFIIVLAAVAIMLTTFFAAYGIVKLAEAFL